MTVRNLELRAKDGAAIRSEFCVDEAHDVEGIVIVVHGFGEHLGCYRPLAKGFAHSGYASVLFDQRGHGQLSSPKLRGVIPDYHLFFEDIDSISTEVRRQYPDFPVALYGHSMGGNIITNYLLTRDHSDFSCAVLESPWFGLHKEPGSLIKVLAKMLGGLSPNIATVNKLSADDLTGDTVRAGEYKKDALYHNRISMRMFTGVIKGCTYALQGAGKLELPIYLAYAAHDRIVSNDAIAQFIAAAGSNVTPKMYDCRHAIHNDNQNEVFLSDVVAFFTKNVR